MGTAPSLISRQKNGKFDSIHREGSFLWIGTDTVTGAIVMAMASTAFRLYAPHCGNAIYVWGRMISVVMLALAAGIVWAIDSGHEGGSTGDRK